MDLILSSMDFFENIQRISLRRIQWTVDEAGALFDTWAIRGAHEEWLI